MYVFCNTLCLQTQTDIFYVVLFVTLGVDYIFDLIMVIGTSICILRETKVPVRNGGP